MRRGAGEHESNSRPRTPLPFLPVSLVPCPLSRSTKMKVHPAMLYENKGTEKFIIDDSGYPAGGAPGGWER